MNKLTLRLFNRALNYRSLCKSLAFAFIVTIVFALFGELVYGEDIPPIENSKRSGLIHVTLEQRELAGIKIAVMSEMNFNFNSVATGSVLVDRDRTQILVSQRDVKVEKRHVVPGENIILGQTLLTLGGDAVAQAQAEYINASAAWDRMKRMDRSATSDSVFLETFVDAQRKRTVLKSMAMTDEQIKKLEARPELIGNFKLFAPMSGRVQQDFTVLGQVVPSGTMLMQITDESYLWVEAQVTPYQSKQVKVGNKALVRVGDINVVADIIGRSHEIDSVTRTEQILLAFENPEHLIHVGQFAEIYLPDQSQKGMLLPDAALTRGSDGDWQVFIEGKDGFEAIEVEVVQRQRGMNLIRGIESGSKVVISGAFFIASELAKSGFDIHGH